MTTAWTLHRGDPAPVQQSPVTCGSAALTVARMLGDPGFAAWVLTGGTGAASGGFDAPALARFAAQERVAMGRTNSAVAAGGALNLPWPSSLGTPSWGARAELQESTHSRYAVSQLRWAGGGGRRRAYRRLCSTVTAARPALLYVGNVWLPRHITLLLPPEGDARLTVYEPASGTVLALPEGELVGGRLGLGGWDEPWLLVEPDG
ncbi:MAG: hypothetical protein ACTHJ6_12755, partial [Oryzihumus sp.]